MTRLRDRVLPPLVSALGPLALRAFASTWRCRRLAPDPLAASNGRGDRFIIALWHNTLLPAAWMFRRDRATVLVSQHGDGELIVRVLEHLGFAVARGSTTRGGARALRELLRAARDGHLAITPDGPRGPARKAQPGIGFLAAATGLPILPLALANARPIRLNSWDRFEIPRPFTRVAVAFGEPILVPRDAMESGFEPHLARLEQTMVEAEQRAAAVLAEPW